MDIKLSGFKLYQYSIVPFDRFAIDTSLTIEYILILQGVPINMGIQ